MADQPVTRDELLPLLELALRAPSGDNCQPWRFVARPGEVEVWFDAPRARAILDVADYASRMGLGALLESLALAGRARGVTVEWTLNPDPARAGLWALAKLGRAAPVAEPLADQLVERHTNRTAFEAAPLPAEDQAALLAEAVPGTRLRLLTDRAKVAKLAELADTTDRIRVQNERAHRELYHWLRWSKEEAEATRDGLDVRTLAASKADLLALRAMEPWTVARVSMKLGGARMMGEFARKQVLASGAMALLSVDALTPATVTDVGRSFLRVWLRATERKLAVCPHAALPLLFLRTELLAGSEIDRRAVDELRRLGPALRQLFGLGAGEQAPMLFRVGRAAPYPVRSLRRDVRELVS